MVQVPMTGAVNPYALTEVLAGRRINWRRIADPVGFVAKRLETPEEDLFDGGGKSPVVLAPEAFGQRGELGENGRERSPEVRSENGGSGDPRPGLRLNSRISDDLRERLEAILLPLPWLEETEYPGASWTDIGDFYEEATEFADPMQGALGDCWLIAALASVAWSRPYAIMQRNRSTGPNNPDFVDAIDLKHGASNTRTYEVTERIPVVTGPACRSMPARSSRARSGRACTRRRSPSCARATSRTSPTFVR